MKQRLTQRLLGIGFLILGCVIFISHIPQIIEQLSAAGTTYYVDATEGNDSNTGTSEGQAWKTLNKINTSSFNPGDTILLQRGEVWHESLVLPSSGTAGNPITVGAYGTGDNPQIMKTDHYTDWWEHSLVTNGSFENFTGTKDDDVADTFAGFSLLPLDSDVIEAVSDAEFGSTALSINKTTANNYGSWFRQSKTVTGSTTYYFEYRGKREPTAYLLVQIRDNTNTQYLQDDLTWGASSNYVDLLAITSSDWTTRNASFTTNSNTVSIDLRFYNYSGSGNVNTGTGRNYVDDIYLAPGATKPTAKVWIGYSPNFVNSWGVIDDGERKNHHSQTSGIDEFTLTDEYFYSKLNSNYFHYRKDSGIPTETEVGARPYGILIDDHAYITISNIDVYGTGGKNETGSSKSHSIMISGTANNITIQDAELSNGGHDVYGIWAENTTTDVLMKNLTVHSNGSTGIYHNGTGTVENCTAYDNGTLPSDVGDGGGIGSYQSPGVTIQHNTVYNNAKDTEDGDFEISVVAPTGPATVHGNSVHTCKQGCIQISEGGTGSVISYNIVNGFGTATAAASSHGKYSGIRMAVEPHFLE